MASFRSNLVANYAGRGVSALSSLLFIPFYIRYLGIEGYGLVGFFVMLQSLFAVLDFGLSPTVNRELARLSTQAGSALTIRNLVRTLEAIYWSIGAAIGIVIVVLAPLLARHWVKPQALSVGTVETSVMLIGVVIALQWPFSFYEGGLTGLQQLVAYNWLQSILSIVRGLGAIAILRFVSPTVVAFFLWQVVVSLAGGIVSALLLWHYIPAGTAPRFDRSLLRGLRRFAADVTLISVLFVGLVQSDKLVLSKRLPLASFGYYNLAFVVGFSLNYLIYPASTAVFGRFSQCLALGDEKLLRRTYHASCQLVTVLSAPAAFVLAAFSWNVMRWWTGNQVTAENTATIVSIAVIGTLLAGFVQVPYALQLASGWTGLALYTNALSLLVQIPLLIFMAGRYGAVGAASVWLMLNFVNFIGTVNVMFSRLLVGERWHWYLHDVAMPALAALAVVVVAKITLPDEPPLLMVPALVAVTGLAFVAAAVAAPQGRAAMQEAWTGFRHKVSS